MRARHFTVAIQREHTRPNRVQEVRALSRQYCGDTGADAISSDQRRCPNFNARNICDGIQRARLTGQRQSKSTRPRAARKAKPVGLMRLLGQARHLGKDVFKTMQIEA